MNKCLFPLAGLYAVLASTAFAAEEAVVATAANIKSDTIKPKHEYNITINYELGMHCTGFDFTYCCILPPYNSIQSQVTKNALGSDETPKLLGSDPKDHTVLVDGDKRYQLKYGHLDNTYSEGAKLAYWAVPYDVNKDGKYTKNDTVGNAYFTHLYIYSGLEGANPNNTSSDAEKKRFGLEIPIPEDNGIAGSLFPSPIKGGNLHYTNETGTVVYTKSPVLDNVPITLTNPGIWDALALPLTPFYDSTMNKNPLTRVESEIVPYQEAWVSMVDADSGKPVLDKVTGKPVYFSGTNPIDVPNCSNCHSNENANGEAYQLYKEEKSFWKSMGATDYVANLKATSVSVLQIHDAKHGTQFLANYQPDSRATGNRLGRDPVLCQKCHADNIIGVLKSKGVIEGMTDEKLSTDIPIPPLSQAIHHAHLVERPLPDTQGRSNTCAGCHPAHRQNGSMEGYPITLDGKNAYADADNRDSKGGCFAGRDVHSNPGKEDDVGTPEHLNSIGKWLQDNISQIGKNNRVKGKGLWCTNCHNQLSRELYQRDNITQAFKQEGETLRNKSLDEIAKAIGVNRKELEEKFMDPKVVLDKYGRNTPGKSGILDTWSAKRMVPDIAVIATKGGSPLIKTDGDGDPNVTILSPNPAVDISTLKLPEGADGATAVSYEAASHGRDYWLSPGVPHCADCHEAPYVEGQGGAAFPINQPGKYSQMRYSKGHAGLSCQACHQSIHGLYPVTDRVDTTTYRQATQYNPDGSHGPLKCGACHETNKAGVALIAKDKKWQGQKVIDNFDAAVTWMHGSAPDIGGKIPEPKKQQDAKSNTQAKITN